MSLFELPLLSHRRQVHDSLSDSPGAFDAVLDAMASIRYHRGRFVSVFVGTKLNLADLHDTIEMAFAFGASSLMLNRMNVGGRGCAHVEELLPSAGEVREMLAVANAAVDEFRFPISCSVAIQPCNHTPTILGNLFEESFADLVAPERLSPFLEAVPDFCRPCKLRDKCQGGCKAAAEVCYGSSRTPEPFLQRNLASARPLLSDV